MVVEEEDPDEEAHKSSNDDRVRDHQMQNSSAMTSSRTADAAASSQDPDASGQHRAEEIVEEDHDDSNKLHVVEDVAEGDDEEQEGEEEEEEGKEESAAGSFECNICLELAQDPVVTLCGHLFCWPCLYKWMQMRTVAKDCPVCKAQIQEAKVIPLYGRGNSDTSSSSSPSSAPPSSSSEMMIPNRPSGQRSSSTIIPTTNLTWHSRNNMYDPYGLGFIAGPTGPSATARFGNVTFSAGFGLFPSLFRLQFHGFPDNPSPSSSTSTSTSPSANIPPYGSLYRNTDFPTNYSMQQPYSVQQTPDQQETLLSRLLLFVGGVMILCFLYL